MVTVFPSAKVNVAVPGGLSGAFFSCAIDPRVRNTSKTATADVRTAFIAFSFRSARVRFYVALYYSRQRGTLQSRDERFRREAGRVGALRVPDGSSARQVGRRARHADRRATEGRPARGLLPKCPATGETRDGHSDCDEGHHRREGTGCVGDGRDTEGKKLRQRVGLQSLR